MDDAFYQQTTWSGLSIIFYNSGVLKSGQRWGGGPTCKTELMYDTPFAELMYNYGIRGMCPKFIQETDY